MAHRCSLPREGRVVGEAGCKEASRAHSLAAPCFPALAFLRLGLLCRWHGFSGPHSHSERECDRAVCCKAVATPSISLEDVKEPLADDASSRHAKTAIW